MRISEQVKFQIMTDVQETLSRLCQKYNMPNLKITENNKLLTEQFNKAFEEGFILSLKEPEKSELMGNPAHLQVKMVMKKKEFFQDLQNNIFKKQYITKIGKNATFSADKFGDLINYLLNTCIAEGIDQKIDQRLDDVLIDFFGENQLTDEVINIMRNHKIIAAQNIKANSNPAINSEQRQKVWSTEISKMLSAILLSIKTLSLEANKDYKSILN